MLAAFLSSCATTPITIGWIANNTVDEFSDAQNCKVTWAIQSGGSAYREVFKLYPVVFFKPDGSVEVGVESVSMNRRLKVDIPVGNVQLRIDGNSAHTIEAFDQEAFQASVSEGNQALAMQAQMSEIMSPMTLAEGAEATSILAEMLSGQQIKIRQITPGNTGYTGTFSLTGFTAATNNCR